MANVTVGAHPADVEAAVDDVPARRWWRPAAIYLTIGAVVWVVVFVAAQILPRDYLFPRPRTYPGGPLAEMWMRWDANWYREIIRHGYRYYPGVQSSVAYFPAYPMAVLAIAWAFPGVPAAAIAVTVLSGLGAAVLFHRWCCARMSRARRDDRAARAARCTPTPGTSSAPSTPTPSSSCWCWPPSCSSSASATGWPGSSAWS